MQPIQNATFELWAKDNTGCLLKFYKKTQIFLQDFPRTLWKNMDFIPIKSNKNQSILCSYSGVITSQIELTIKARRSKKHSSFSVKYCKCLFFFLIFFSPSPVLRPASFSPLLYFVRNFLELSELVCYRFRHVNNMSSLKTEAVP